MGNCHWEQFIILTTQQGSVTYQLPSAGLTWSSVFRQIEANKERLSIVDYTVSQTTLEQVSRVSHKSCSHVMWFIYLCRFSFTLPKNREKKHDLLLRQSNC